jgi:hypothetical protein
MKNLLISHTASQPPYSVKVKHYLQLIYKKPIIININCLAQPFELK